MNVSAADDSQRPRRESPCPACGVSSAAQPIGQAMGEQGGTSPLDAAAKTFNRVAMRRDFLRRWHSFNDGQPSDELTENYVDQWAENLKREGWRES